MFGRATSSTSTQIHQIHLDPPWIWDSSKCLVQLHLPLYLTSTWARRQNEKIINGLLLLPPARAWGKKNPWACEGAASAGECAVGLSIRTPTYDVVGWSERGGGLSGLAPVRRRRQARRTTAAMATAGLGEAQGSSHGHGLAWAWPRWGPISQRWHAVRAS
jgi:hypothetical protein